MSTETGYREKTPVTPEVLDQLLESRIDEYLRQARVEQQKQEWPLHVNEALVSLARAVGALQDRLAVVEAKLGLSTD